MKKQSGVFLLEALVAILIFAFGALGMLAMSSAAISGQTDARVRTDAANLADQLAGQIALNVDRTSLATVMSSVLPFALNVDATTVPGVNPCVMPAVPNTPNAANPSANGVINNWVAAVTGPGGLPGATPASLSVFVDTSNGENAVTITECWQGPKDQAQRSYTTTVYINY